MLASPSPCDTKNKPESESVRRVREGLEVYSNLLYIVVQTNATIILILAAFCWA